MEEGVAEPPIPFGPRMVNLLKCHFRGLIGFFVSIHFLTFLGKDKQSTVQAMWLMMSWFFLWHPVHVPATGIIPLFFLPLTGALSSDIVCRCYFNENIALLILSGILLLALNNCGFDRRAILKILCMCDQKYFTGIKLILKASFAAYLMSMLSNRHIVTSTIIEFLTISLTDIQTNVELTDGRKHVAEVFETTRSIINNAVQTSASIGSIAIMHSALATITFRAVFTESANFGLEYPDVFNYLQYFCFAFPVTLLMYIANVCYHIVIYKISISTPLNEECRSQLKKALTDYKASVPEKLTCHEKLAISLTVLMYLAFMSRWTTWHWGTGWSNFDENFPEIPIIQDATVAALFVMVFHACPKSFKWMSYFRSKPRHELPPLKPESGVLYWHFVNSNANYGYMFTIGGGLALNEAIKISKLGAKSLTMFTDLNLFLMFVCVSSAALANMMTGVAAVVTFMPVVLYMAPEDFQSQKHLTALAVGVGSSLGFMWPFMYTPAYFCHYVGRVSMLKMAKYSIGTVIICCFILWTSLIVWAPIVLGDAIEPVKSDVNATNMGGKGLLQFSTMPLGLEFRVLVFPKIYNFFNNFIILYVCCVFDVL